MADQSMRDFIAGVVRSTTDDEETPVREQRVRSPATEPGRPKRDRPGWKDPDVRRRGTMPPSGGVRGQPF